MEKRAFLTLLFLLIVGRGYSQDKTHAFFMIGDYDSPQWEKIEFDLTGQGKEITYSYRTNERGHKLQLLGMKYAGTRKELTVKITGTTKIYVLLSDPKNRRITMLSKDGTYKKTFALGYEGPVNGVGTYCDHCANEPEDAFKLVDVFFL